MAKVMVLGDSYISRLKNFTEVGCPNLKLATSWWISFNGKRGGKVQHLKSVLLPDAEKFHPEIIFIQIGANDLCKSEVVPDYLADEIVGMAEAAIMNIEEVKYVVIGGLIRRTQRNPCYFSLDMSLERYNERISQTNELLELKVKECYFSENLRFWKHRGFSKEVDWLSKMDADGVHLNDLGLLKFANSVKNAITHAKGNICRFDL